MTRDEILLDVRQLKQHFRVNGELTVKAVDGVSFQMRKGEIFGLVGESGCGKSTLARTLMGIYAPTAGEIFYKGDFVSGGAARRKGLCGDMQIVFQDSASALNPRMTVGEIIAEPLLLRGLCKRKGETDQRVIQLLRMVGMDGDYQRYYPGEISGGQRQRVAIARSIGAQPALIVADEPIASLDVSMQAQIVNLFLDLQAERQFSLLFITHDLSMVRFISDRVGVMYRGKLVEIAAAEELFSNPLHPYTQSLLSAIPVPDPRRERQKKIRVFHASGQNLDGVLSEASSGHYVLR